MRKLDRFALADTIAQTDIASLVRATENMLDVATRPVLLKIFPSISGPASVATSAFAAEIRNLSAIGPASHLLAFYAAGVTDTYPWIAMEPAIATLAGSISDVPADPRIVIRLLEGVLAGLAAVHGKGLLHNAILPDNIVLTTPAPDQHFKLNELALAAPPNANTTQQAAMVRYSAPEAIHKDFGNPSPSTDLYSLGQVAYELSLGSRLWRAQFPAVFEPGSRPKDTVNPAKWMAWHCSSSTRLTPISDLQRNYPLALASFIDRLTAKEPARRFTSAAEALAALKDAAATPTPAAVMPSTSSSARSANLAPIPLDEPTMPRSGASRHAPVAAPSPVAAPPAPPEPAAAPSGTTYFIRMRGRQSGPFDLSTLQRYVRSGQLSRLHQISTDGTNWRPATTIDGLFT